VASSRIEGLVLSHRRLAKAAFSPEMHDVTAQGVLANIHALERAIELASSGDQLETGHLLEVHRILFEGTRDEELGGEIRKEQSWIGGAASSPRTAKFVPPPPELVSELLEDLCAFSNRTDMPAAIQAAIAHVQFETIHPFLDGNGRIGRLLITLLLEHWNIMTTPLLYLSLAFKRNQQEYYNRLSAVRTDGDWESWTSFYLGCVREAAENGVDVAQRLFALLGKDRRRLASHERATVAAIRLLDVMPEHPIVTASNASDVLKVTAPAARKAIDLLADIGILRETTGKQRDRVFAYHRYLQILTGGES
jgi:Fic family protein